MKQKNMLLTTTNTLQGYHIEAYLGVVTGEVIMGANIMRDIGAAVRDIIGGRAGSYERTLNESKEQAFQELIARAADMGANAIIGIDLDFETVGQGSMLMVSISGTAVVARREGE